MEAFSLLKYWKDTGGGGLGTVDAVSKLGLAGHSTGAPTVVDSATNEDVSEGEGSDEDDDDGPFINLEFSVPAGEDEDEDEGRDDGGSSAVESDEEQGKVEDSDGTVVGEGTEFKFRLSSSGSSDTDLADVPKVALSPSDDLFFNGRLVAIEPASSSKADVDTKSAAKPVLETLDAAQLSASFLKSATKLRVFMLGLKKSKTNGATTEKSEANNCITRERDKPQPQPQRQRNLFTVKFKVEEVPLVSLFKRDNSSKNSSSSSSSSLKKQNGEDTDVLEEKRFVMMEKYLKKVKPLYLRVSRRYSEKLRFSGQLSCTAPPAVTTEDRDQPEEPKAPPVTAPAKNHKQINFPAGLKVVGKRLRKSRSASSAVPTTPSVVAGPPEESRRRDDSLLQQQDGIQGAILHCKRSFNSSRDPEASLLARSVSSPSHENSLDSSLQ